MLVSFEELPDTSRIWIYQANRPFTEEELEEIRPKMDAFLKEWTAHGSQLQAGYEIKYRRFLVVALDQSVASASGCSIDASVRFIQELEKQYDVELLDKMNVTFKQGPYVSYKSLKDFKKMASQRSISKNTIVFNNLVTNKHEYLNHWEVPAEDSWHSRFIK
ncbi:ABC transporter ATPase [Zeaxanthinibacter sp. PT1]|uniref:ABC transporter ATPase n=1 Tax=Zeaxanthinibacter TaxID=561554 RepID=UPI00234B982E|nr:ABC transporter ATPase [Zeaxanthinibacter sp. PT1]MDC6352754.1 ABC transporter ATPase [Zeaxanthinibacter sp. PT1]